MLLCASCSSEGFFRVLLMLISSACILCLMLQAYGADAIIASNAATGRAYRAADLGKLLRDAGASQAATYWELSRQYAVLAPPNVTVYCVYSKGIQTAAALRLVYVLLRYYVFMCMEHGGNATL